MGRKKPEPKVEEPCCNWKKFENKAIDFYDHFLIPKMDEFFSKENLDNIKSKIDIKINEVKSYIDSTIEKNKKNNNYNKKR